MNSVNTKERSVASDQENDLVGISVFGLGYVGAVSAACFARNGHKVVGVDPQQTKVDLINSGEAPIIEKDLPELIRENVASGRISAMTDPQQAVFETDVALICVGTPSRPNGSLDTSSLRKVCEEIGTALSKTDEYKVVVIRSTTLPGTVNGVVRPTLEEFSGKTAGVEFGLCNNPEFLREGTAVYDYDNPPKTVIGATDERAADVVATIYKDLPGPMIKTSIEVAEMCKYADNSWHAVKVAFANEIGNVCKALNIDSHELMDIFCQDDKLNLSSYYMKPGFAFGGSCLPKDVRALTYKARDLDLDVPMLQGVLPSNRRQVERALEMVLGMGRRKISVLGFSFKAGTDDLRESPMVELIERLIGKGYDLKLYDRNVNVARLMGANRDYINKMIPHLPTIMVETMEEALDHGDLIIIGNGDKAFSGIASSLRADQMVLDMVRAHDLERIGSNYCGINW